jgi:arylsulfatase A-like enzyme
MQLAEEKCCVHGAGHYEENLRVPYVVKLPAGGLTGRRELPVRHVDLLPTVLDVAGVPAGSYAGPGSSILKRLAKGRAVEPFFSYSEADARCISRMAVVDERFKYIYTPNRLIDRLLAQSPLFVDNECSRHPPCSRVQAEELYDLSSDPSEQTNLMKGELARVPAAALERLRAELTTHLNVAPAYKHRLAFGSGSPDGLDDATREALRSLGYVQ